MIQIDGRVARLQQGFGPIENRQCLQPEKIELHKAGFFRPFQIKLGNREIGARIAVERNKLGKRAVADDNASGMGGGVTRPAFELAGNANQHFDLSVRLHFGAEFGDAGKRALQIPRVCRIGGDEFGKAIHLPIRKLQHPADILDDGARLQRPEGDDLRHLLAAIFLLNIADNLFPPRFAKVDIEIRHGFARRIEKALENQAKGKRIDIGYAERPRDHRSCTGAAPGANRNGLRLGPLDEIGHDQEIAGEAHVFDDAKLKIQPLSIGGMIQLWNGSESLFEASGCQVTQGFLFLVAVCEELGKNRFALFERERTALGHKAAIGDGFGKIGKAQRHFGRACRQHVLRIGSAAIGAFNIGAVCNAEHHIMRFMAVRLQKAGDCGGNKRRAEGVCEIDKRGFASVLHSVAAAGDFNEQAVAEQRLQAVGERAGLIGLAFSIEPGQRPIGSTSESQQTGGAALQPGQIGVAFEVRSRHQRKQILPPFRILHQQGQMIHRGQRSRPQAACRNRADQRQSNADDRLHSQLHAGFGESHGSK